MSPAVRKQSRAAVLCFSSTSQCVEQPRVGQVNRSHTGGARNRMESVRREMLAGAGRGAGSSEKEAAATGWGGGSGAKDGCGLGARREQGRQVEGIGGNVQSMREEHRLESGQTTDKWEQCCRNTSSFSGTRTASWAEVKRRKQ